MGQEIRRELNLQKMRETIQSLRNRPTGDIFFELQRVPPFSDMGRKKFAAMKLAVEILRSVNGRDDKELAAICRKIVKLIKAAERAVGLRELSIEIRR